MQAKQELRTILNLVIARSAIVHSTKRASWRLVAEHSTVKEVLVQLLQLIGALCRDHLPPLRPEREGLAWVFS